MAQYESDSRRLGGSLTILDAIAQSVGFMGPVFSMAFLVPLVVGLNASGQGAGNAAPLAVVLATIGVLGIGWIISEYARRISAAGSLYDYISDGFGPRVGAGFGFVYYAGIMGLGAGLLVMIGGTIHDTLDAEFGNALLPEGVWDVLLLVLVAAILYLGVALSTRIQLVLAFASIATVLVFALYVIIKVGSGNHLGTAFTPGDSGLKGVLFGVLYGVLLFTGFETAANLGEETTHPKRDIPRAVLASVLAVAGFYVIVTYSQIAGFGFSLDNLSKAATGPLFALAGPTSAGGFGSVAVGRLVELMVVLDMIAVLIGVSVSASRGIFALSRDRRLPHALSGVSSRRTPVNASAVLVSFYVIVVLVTLFWSSFVALDKTPHYVAVFSWFSTLGSVCLGAIYLVMCLGALSGLSDHPNKPALYLAVAIGTVVMLLALFGAVYQVQAPTIWTAWAALALLALGFVLTWVFPGEDSQDHHWSELTPADQGPTKL